MGWALAFTRRTLLADMQWALGSEGLWEGCAAITLIVVVDVIAKQPTRSLWRERRDGERQKGERKTDRHKGREETRGRVKNMF